jgi:ribosome maturation factor RimP
VGFWPLFFVLTASWVEKIAEKDFEIERLVTPTLEAMGFSVVRVRIAGQPERTLQIMVELLDGSTVTVDDCGKISRAVSALLDVEDAIKGAYSLEVSSPGIDRPLIKPADFERFAGHVAKIETHRPLAGRKRFRGRLVCVEDGDVRIEVEGEVAAIPLAEIATAKLVLTDELIAEAVKSGSA